MQVFFKIGFVKKLFLFLMLISQVSYAQLSGFTLNLSKVDESCTSNGVLNFNVSGTSSGATITYTIYKLPNVTTPVLSTTDNSLTNITAGIYRVIATQNLGSLNNTQQQDITINSTIVPLAYAILGTNAICGNDGSIQVNVTSGVFVSCEIISGTATRPLQTSNVLTGLSAGVYNVRVFDNCGQGVVQTFTLGTNPASLVIGAATSSAFSCTDANLELSFSVLSGTVFAFPINVVCTIAPPIGAPVVSNQIITSASLNPDGTVNFSQLFQIYPQGSGYTIQVTDRCGNIRTVSGVTNSSLSTPSYSVINLSCTEKRLVISGVSSVILTSAPSAFPVTVPNNYTPQISALSVLKIDDIKSGNYVFNVISLCGVASVLNINVPNNPVTTDPPTSEITFRSCLLSNFLVKNVKTIILTTAPAGFPLPLPHNYTAQLVANTLTLNGVPNGTYIFNVTDLCNIPTVLTVVVTATSSVPVASVSEGCDIGIGSIALFGNFSTVKVIGAPAGFGFPLPYNASLGIGVGYFALVNLPAGIYVFETVDTCNTLYTISATVQGFKIFSSNVTILPNCGSFNLNLQHLTNGLNNTFWLQKLNPVTNLWEHPATGVVYDPAFSPSSITALQVINNTITYNLAFTGTFRIVNVFVATTVSCVSVIKTFTFDGFPKINEVYSFACANNKFDVIVDAGGAAPLNYKITLKDGLPFILNNANVNIFTTLDPGQYNFQVEDGCGNIVNSQFSVPRPLLFDLTATVFCAGQNGTLSVPNFSFLQYQWWKDNNTTNLLGTSSNLTLNNFNPVTNAGVYHVRIKYTTNPNSCINFVLDYTIPLNNNVPIAGQDNLVSYCYNQGIINLDNLIIGSHTAGGTWTETSSSGVLVVNNSWNSSTVPAGNYRFKYKVSSVCGTSDESVIDIIYKPKPNFPIINVNDTFCSGQNIDLKVNTTLLATYLWTGPNGFTSALQNPFINNCVAANSGNYTVTVSLNGCALSASKFINVNTIVPVNAGQDNIQNYCFNQGNINLNDLIIGNFDAGGTWSEITSSGIPIVNNVWNSTSINTGNYQFKYKILGNCSTFDESLITINYNLQPTATITTIADVFCSGQTINFNTNSTAGASYSWSGPNGFVSNLQNPVLTNVTTLNSGNYTVMLTANNCAASAVKNITVNSTTPPKAGQDNTIIYCGTQGNINLESLIIGSFDVGGIWTETTSSGGIITNNTWNSSNVASGNYQFTYKVIGGCNQSDESVVSIKIDPILPNPMINANSNLCDGEVLQFSSNFIAGANYSWSGPNGFISNSQNPSINNCSNANSGNYFLTVNSGSCSSTNAINIAVAPKVEFDLNAGCLDGNYVIRAIPIANSYNPITSSFNWSGPKNFVSNLEEIILSGSESIGEFNLTITNANGCSASRKVNVVSTACSIQTGISPNNDGKNENFDLSGLGQDVNLEIFNRYGTKVFWQDDYSNQWHGQDYNDSLLPDAIYFYLVKLADNQVKTGWVYLSKEVR